MHYNTWKSWLHELTSRDYLLHWALLTCRPSTSNYFNADNMLLFTVNISQQIYALDGRKSHLRPCIVLKKLGGSCPQTPIQITDSTLFKNMLNWACNPGSLLYSFVVSNSFFYCHILVHTQIGKVKVKVRRLLPMQV